VAPDYVFVLSGRTAVRITHPRREEGETWRSFATYVADHQSEPRSWEIPRGYPPKLAIHPPVVFFWGSATVWWSYTDNSLPRRAGCRTFSEDVIAVYRVGWHWVVLTELGVTVLDDMLETEVARFATADVVVNHRWDGDTLVMQDLRGKTTRYDCSAL
jgi:hypothetical protein